MSNLITKFSEFNEINESKKKTIKHEISKTDEEKYLSAKQQKLPDALKKGIIERAKKQKDKPCEECEEKPEKEKEEVKSDISKSDEEKYLSPKQRNLPEGLKKGIIKRKKKED